MDTTTLVAVVAFTALAMVCGFNAVAVWQVRRIVLAVFGEDPVPAQLGQRGYYILLPGPGSSGPAPGTAKEPPPTVRPGSRERRPGAPEAITAQPDLAAVARDLDAADQAQAGQAPEPSRAPSTRPPAASGEQVTGAPAASGSVAAPAAPMVAAGLGTRPSGAHSQRPPPPPPRKVPPATPPPRSPAPSVAPVATTEIGGDDDDAALTHPGKLPAPHAEGGFDDSEEVTRMFDGPGASTPAKEPRPKPKPRIFATLHSMTAVVPPSARAAPEVRVVEAPATGPNGTPAPPAVQ